MNRSASVKAGAHETNVKRIKVLKRRIIDTTVKELTKQFLVLPMTKQCLHSPLCLYSNVGLANRMKITSAVVALIKDNVLNLVSTSWKGKLFLKTCTLILDPDILPTVPEIVYILTV